MPKEIEGKEEVDLGYFLVPSAWRCGYAVEAARQVCSYAFDHLGLSTLVAVIHPENVRSQAVAMRLGMTLEQDLVGEEGGVRRIYRISPAHLRLED